MTFDTPRRERTVIPGSTKPLRLDTLQSLAQRWDSPQATSGMPYPSWISPSSFSDLKQKRFKKLIRLVPVNLLPAARRKLEQCSRTA